MPEYTVTTAPPRALGVEEETHTFTTWRNGRAYVAFPFILQLLAWVPTRLLLNTFCRFEVRGKEHLKGLKQAIFALNHSNELDPIIITAALNPLGRFAPLFYVASPAKDFKSMGFGWRRHLYGGLFFEAWGAYAIWQGLKNYAKALEQHTAILKDGQTLVIFPEGRRTRDGTLQEGHGGVTFLNHASNVPIVPVALSGTFGLSPRRFLTRKNTVVLTFGKPMSGSDLFSCEGAPEVEDFKKGAACVMKAIGKLLGR